MIALRISGAPWPALVTSTPELQSSHRLPYLSYTETSSARSHTSGGCPRMDCGSNLRSFSSVATESGCGTCVTMRRYFVSTRGTLRGVMLNSLPIKARDIYHPGRNERSSNCERQEDRGMRLYRSAQLRL